MAIGALTGTAAAAASTAHTGRIALYHLNAESPGRGVCVRMNPAVPGQGWLCLYTTSPLYSEISTLLLSAQIHERTCTIATNGNGPDGLPAISGAECN